MNRIDFQIIVHVHGLRVKDLQGVLGRREKLFTLQRMVLQAEDRQDRLAAAEAPHRSPEEEGRPEAAARQSLAVRQARQGNRPAAAAGSRSAGPATPRLAAGAPSRPSLSKAGRRRP